MEEIDFAALANINLEDELTSDAPASSLELSAEQASRPEGLSPAGQHLANAFSGTASSAGPSSGKGSSARRRKDNDSPGDVKGSNVTGMGFLKGFGGVQKKTTRDGQPAKRRGPKPDSKPAQTRRQELNRQAQRTHRERKEQYIKALETELSRLREGYTSDVASMNTSLEQHKVALREHQEENSILREMLASRGIPFQNELKSRKAAAGIKPRNPSFGSSAAMSGGSNYNSVISAPSSSSGFSPPHTGSDRAHGAGRGGIFSGGSASGTAHHGQSSADPGVFEQSIKRESTGISDMPGIFEKDPQLQVEFILALEETCRDHHEYLVRRSVGSPDDSEDALISGHALMACCPPPNHISNVPAQQNGLVPTYPHQVPQIPAANLNTLLNLSRQIMAQGLVEGGQVTPIMALQSLRTHNRYHLLTRQDVFGMIEAIKNKVRCYGFGAVMEDFELRDALSSVFATKFETYEQAFGSEAVAEVDDLYS